MRGKKDYWNIQLYGGPDDGTFYAVSDLPPVWEMEGGVHNQRVRYIRSGKVTDDKEDLFSATRGDIIYFYEGYLDRNRNQNEKL